MLEGIMLCHLCCLCCLKCCIDSVRPHIVLDLARLRDSRSLFQTSRKDDKGYTSMIHFCACKKSPSSALVNPKPRVSLKSCKSCGGKLLVDGRGAQQGRMLSNRGVELRSSLDPHLAWKTVSKGRQRAVRRARTSFTGVITNANNSKASTDLSYKDSSSTGDMPVSESEKVGVSILGRRFSDTAESVPIKKRRFLRVQSPLPPHNSSSYSDDSGPVLEGQSSTYQCAVLNVEHTLGTSSGSGLEIGQEGKFGEAADFSGISILAAAACDNNIRGEIMNVESLPQEHTSEVLKVSKENATLGFTPNDREDPLPHSSEDLVGRTDLPFEESSSLVFCIKDSNEVKSDGSCNLETSVNSLQNVPNKITEPLRDVKFPWDLNVVMDPWDSHHEDLNSDREATKKACEVADHDDKAGSAESSMNQVGFGESKTASIGSQIVDSRDSLSGGEQKVICTSVVKTEEKPGMSSDNLSADSKVQPFFSTHGATQVEERHSRDAINFANACEETKPLINKDSSCSITGDLPSVSVLEEGKTEANCVNFQSNLKSEELPPYLISCTKAVLHPSSNDTGSHHGMNKGHIEAGTDVRMEEIAHTRSPRVEKHEPYFSVDSGAYKSDQNSLVCHLAEKSPEVLIDGNACHKMVTGCMISGANVTACYSAGKFKLPVADEGETTAAEAKMENSKFYLRKDGMVTAKDCFPANIGIEVPICESAGTTAPVNPHAPSISGSQEACKYNRDGPAGNPGQGSLDNNLDCHYSSDVSHKVVDEATGMEKVDCLGDDDSQYEDGEFRESLANCWMDDIQGEGETEHVDYGSDRDTDIEAASDNNVSQSFQNGPSSANVSDAGSGKLNARSAAGNGLLGDSRKTAGIDPLEGDRFVKESDAARRSSNSVSYRKISGWDRLPGGYKSPTNGSISRNHNDASSYISRAGDIHNRVVGSSLRRDSSSRIENDDKYYGTPTRSNGCNGFDPRVERDRGDPRPLGRSRSSLHLQGRGRGDDWVDSSSKHLSNSRHDSSGYYGPASFSRNAAAAAVAKVESNGFVVAPDGTIVKANGVGATGHMTRCPVKSRSPMGRGSPIERERPFGCSREMSPNRPMFAGRGKPVRYGPAERYCGPIPDDMVNSSSSMHHTIPRRDHSFSPHYRKPLHLSRSHSRSPSRSRTRSPHRWASPRGRSPGLRRRSRSPSFKSEARMVRRPRAGFGEHIGSYHSLSRNQASPPRGSRWIDGRKEATEHFRDFQYKRRPGRSPPLARDFSRGRRFDLMDSPGRPRLDEYPRPDFVGFGRGSRQDGKDYVNDGNMKRLRDDYGNGFMGMKPRPKSSEFQQRENPRGFDRGNERKVGDSPRRSSKEENGRFRKL